MNKPYTYPGHIPQKFALAVYDVLHNKADWQSWTVLDICCTQGNRLGYKWIWQILHANSMDAQEVENNLQWFKEQLEPIPFRFSNN